MRVLHDHGQGGMPEEVGYGLHAVTVHRQVRCEGMPQIMEPEVDDAGSTTSSGKPVLNVLPGLAMLIAKDISRFEMVSLTHFSENLLGSQVQGNYPGLHSFGVVDVSGLGPNMFPLEV